MVRGKEALYIFTVGGKQVSADPGNQMCDHSSCGRFSHSLIHVFICVNMQLNKVRWYSDYAHRVWNLLPVIVF